MGCYLRPTELSEALEALAAPGDGALEIIAGGTDFYPARVDRAPEWEVGHARSVFSEQAATISDESAKLVHAVVVNCGISINP